MFMYGIEALQEGMMALKVWLAVMFTVGLMNLFR